MITLPNLADGSGPYDAILDEIARTLYNEQAGKGSIPLSLYKQVSGDLLKALDEGLGGIEFPITDSRNLLKAYLQQNVCAFSAAKSLTEMNYMRGLMADAKNYTDFRNKCFDAGVLFNDNWLKAEYTTFSASAQMAWQWEQFQGNGVQYLEFSTVGDDRVRPAHAALDGLTLRADSPAIRRIWPPLDWLCRCTMIPGVASRAKGDQEVGKLVKDVVKNPLFFKHSGLDKVVISDKHPYFNAMPIELDAQKNYGLKSVKHLYNQNEFEPHIEMGSEAEYKAWWKDQVNIKGTDNFVLKDKTGVQVLFDSVETPGANKAATSYFKDHIIQKSAENRWQYAANLTDIITDPDELWSTRMGEKIVRYYIKYFNKAPMLVIARDKAGSMVAETMYQLTTARATELRRGELLFIKR